ncbi:MAG: hypothetical protein E6R04_05130 [Spirochaetes bacterium]|nr:MAG: hypothetical protein E6R04_05130 [Spirochaetota bacterium]
MILCTKCEEPRDDSEFYRDKSKKLGFNQPCKKCHRELRREYKRKAKVKEKLKRRGITEVQFKAMLEAQNHACAICRKPASTQEKSLHIDHDHKTGKVRGLLCSHCNFMIGHALDSSETLLAGAAYLNSFK